MWPTFTGEDSKKNLLIKKGEHKEITTLISLTQAQ